MRCLSGHRLWSVYVGRVIQSLASKYFSSLLSWELDGNELTDSAIRSVSTCHGLNTLSITFTELLTDQSLRHLKVKRGQVESQVGWKVEFQVGQMRCQPQGAKRNCASCVFVCVCVCVCVCVQDLSLAGGWNFQALVYSIVWSSYSGFSLATMVFSSP